MPQSYLRIEGLTQGALGSLEQTAQRSEIDRASSAWLVRLEDYGCLSASLVLAMLTVQSAGKHATGLLIG